MKTTEQLLALYQEANEAYFAGDPIISDAEFDALTILLKDRGALTKPVIGAPERGKKVVLPVPMGSLDQVHDQRELDNWLKNYPSKTTIVCSEKIDGNSALLQYDNGSLTASFSRGDGVMGANNLRHLSKVPTVPHALPGKTTALIRGEVVVQIDHWENNVLPLATNRAGNKYANSRNFVAGFLNGKEGDDALYPYITFVAYEIVGSATSKREQFRQLVDWGFITPAIYDFQAGDYDYEWHERLIQRMIAASPYELDGIVIDIDPAQYRSTAVDLDNLNPPHARKLKLVSQSATTTVREVQWNVSKDGYLKPLVIFDPVTLVGANITKATGHNARNIATLGIGPGAEIEIIRSGEVIPKIIGCHRPVSFVQPENSVWTESGADLVVKDRSKSSDIAQRRLEHFFSTIGAEFVGAGNIRKMIDAGKLTGMHDVPKLTESDWTEVLGAIGQKAYDSIAETLADIEPARLIAAFDVLGRGIGTRKIRAMIDGVELKRFLAGEFSIVELLEIPGFEEKTVTKIWEGLDEMFATLKQFEGAYKFTEGKVNKNEGVFSGQVLCPTGVRFRPEEILAIEQQGGTVVDAISSAVTILVAKDPNKSSTKIDKARAKGIRIASYGEIVASFPQT
jgi:DNA ligase (NAD+)